MRDTHGGESILYYGGGGQGNHLGGAYAPATLQAFGARYRSSALAQEKTGEFWVNARMVGNMTRADAEEMALADIRRILVEDCVRFKNPWPCQSEVYRNT